MPRVTPQFSILMSVVATMLAPQSPARAEVAELEKLRGQYNAAVQAALRPIQRRYLQRLEVVKRDLTRADRLKDALQVKKEIERVKALLAEGADEANGAQVPGQPEGAPPRDSYIHEGIGWKGFHVGATRQELIKFLGRPDSPDDTRWLQWRQRHHMHCLIDSVRGAFELRFDQGCPLRLKNGVQIGTPEREVRAEYGIPTSTVERGHAKKLIYGKKGILFWFAQGKVNQIVVFQPQ